MYRATRRQQHKLEVLANVVANDIVVDDSFAARQFVSLMNGCIKFSNKKIIVFHKATGLWTDKQEALRMCVEELNAELKFEQVTESGDVKIFNFSGNDKNVRNMLKFVSNFCLDDDFIERNIDTSRAKLLFQNGIYDCESGVFSQGFDPNIVFIRRITRDFPEHRDEALISLVNKVLFEDPFLQSEQDAGVFLKKAFAMALFGDFRCKAFYYCVGLSNAGKGVLADALDGAFTQYVGSFNAESQVYKNADPVKHLSWLKIKSRGDKMIGRQNFKNQTIMVNRSTAFCFVKDIPKIDGVQNRVHCVEFKCTFVENITNPDIHRIADSSIKDKFRNNADYKNALCHVMFDAMKLVQKEGLDVPDCVRKSTLESSSIWSLLEGRFELTGDFTEYVTSRELNDFIRKKTNISTKRIALEMKKLGLTHGVETFSGKSHNVWYGVRCSAVFFQGRANAPRSQP